MVVISDNVNWWQWTVAMVGVHPPRVSSALSHIFPEQIQRKLLNLCSANDRTRFVPRTHNTYDDGFSVTLSLDLLCGTVCLQTYNWRHNSVHSSSNSNQYHLVSRDHGALWLFVSVHPINTLTYLLTYKVQTNEMRVSCWRNHTNSWLTFCTSLLLGETFKSFVRCNSDQMPFLSPSVTCADLGENWTKNK